MKNLTFGIAALILCICWKFYSLDTNGVAWKSGCNLLLFFICSVLASVCFYNCFRKISLPIYISKFFSEMGKMSLVIYLIPIVLLPDTFKFDSSWPFSLTNVLILVIGIVNTVFRYSLGKIIFAVPYLRFVLFGKK